MTAPKKNPAIEQWHPSVSCCDTVWEAAYQRFETPEEEIRKFQRRLRALGAPQWPKNAMVVEIFCGRGNGLRALASLGFTDLHGVDLSLSLLEKYDGPGRLYLGDCRDLKFKDRSVDIVIVQGGLHHLPDFPGDVEKTLADVRRVLKSDGRFVIVEPWQTPFLKMVHTISDNPVARKLWDKLDALAVMTERERTTYERWLGRPDEILGLLQKYFNTERQKIGWGKLAYVGRPKS